ncbi:sugar phosphate isomerase/epimerase [Jeotgalibacillus sp. R-1-5s-1]|uniref:sugar phosphate isomerase/epimerase family protein n=1 Tax=Jeotgalibacillus sp. R-1-5s-1 TaxID=2555897 RepID=UPI00106A410D|nr:sugar phosphate isomerase/epimerase [Jeotgalibacillus sp. R-1-5s-1]TFD99676.1 sugar phosphate isomerase/epimerase [Jeotgalibacillus sp. R-1-5s-1]
MKLSLCTISYRHHLRSLPNIASFAAANGFDSMELWGIHAKNLNPFCDPSTLNGVTISMISDYLPLDGELKDLYRKTDELTMLADKWKTTKIRTFAGTKGSESVTQAERKEITRRLRDICARLQGGQKLLVETHPGTLADSLDSTLKLIEEVGHPAFRINFDVLHVWESGANPVEAFHQLEPYIDHLHLKNIADRSQLHVFNPANVYAAAGSREGMVPLFEGAVNYTQFFEQLGSKLDSLTGSLEWFGPDPDTILKHDSQLIQNAGKLMSVK